MKKTFFTILLFIFFNTIAKAVHFEGKATEYSIVMTHLEMCETGSTDSVCLNPITIGTGESSAIDIANTAAGAAAASYGNLSSLKMGVSYSYMQVIMKRQITIAGTVSDGSNTCRTDGNNSDITKHVAGKTSGTPSTITLYIGDTTSGNGNNVNSVSAGDGSGTAQAVGTIDNDDEFVQFRGPIENPVTLKPGQVPTMTIAFGTDEALGYAGSSGGCTATAGETQGLFGASPDVTITIK
tara:strand:+ start:1340 stop:2056 length:717 start_codon:yes stop_codon:yes gene_type:complete